MRPLLDTLLAPSVILELMALTPVLVCQKHAVSSVVVVVVVVLVAAYFSYPQLSTLERWATAQVVVPMRLVSLRMLLEKLDSSKLFLLKLVNQAQEQALDLLLPLVLWLTLSQRMASSN